MKRKLFIGILVLVGGVFLALVATGLAQEAKVFKIGQLVPLTGGGAGWGIPGHQSAELATEEINKAGLVIGNVPYRLEHITYDSKFTLEGTKTGLEKLLYRDKANMVLAFGTEPCVIVKPVVEKEGVLFWPSSWAEWLLDAKTKYTFRVAQTHVEFSDIYFKWLLENGNKLAGQPMKTMVFTAPNNKSGREVGPNAERYAVKAGWQSLGVEYFEPGTKDFYPQVTRILAKKPDAIEGMATPVNDFATLCKQSRELGFEGLTSMISGNPTVFQAVMGKWAEYKLLFIFVDYSQGTPKGREYYKRYMERWKEPPTFLGTESYEAVYITIEAAKKAGSTKTDDIIAVLENPEFQHEGINGLLKFGGKSVYGVRHQMYHDVAISNIQGGKVTKLDTLKAIPKP